MSTDKYILPRTSHHEALRTRNALKAHASAWAGVPTGTKKG